MSFFYIKNGAGRNSLRDVVMLKVARYFLKYRATYQLT